MADINITRKDGRWKVEIDDHDITKHIAGFTVETNPDHPRFPPTVTVRFMPQDGVDFNADDAEVVEVRHEHEWVELTDFSDHEKGERHYVCNRCPQRRIEREVGDDA